MRREIAQDEGLLLDTLSEHLESFRLFRETDQAEADQILEQFGAQGTTEQEMLAQLAERRPLQFPERFGEAHRTAVRAIEVFDRNAARRPASLKAGFLTPIASPVVQLLIRIMVRKHQKRVIDSMRELYALREANSVENSPEFAELRLARKQMTRLSPDLSTRSAGIPAFLLGGAALSTATSYVQRATSDRLVLFVLGIAAILVCLGGFWCILAASGIARRRTRIALDQPLAALWETIGAAGNPPRDASRDFARSAALLLILGWIVVPLAITAVVTLT